MRGSKPQFLARFLSVATRSRRPPEFIGARVAAGNHGPRRHFLGVTAREIIGGNASLAGNISLSVLGGFQNSITPSSTFTVLTATNLSGAFANVASGQRLFTSDGLGSFLVNYGATSTFGIGSVTLTNFIPIPEPSTYALLAVGLLLLGVSLRRRK